MSRLDELIAEGSDLADDTFAHLQGETLRPKAHWATLEAWHSEASDYVAAQSPHNVRRIIPLEPSLGPPEVYARVDGLLRILKSLRSGHASPAVEAVRADPGAAAPAAPIAPPAGGGGQLPASRSRGWRNWPGAALALLRDPLWGGVSALIAVGALIAGIKLVG